jgi:hypothetical protein
VEAESGPPILAEAAKENVRTWRFDEHRPMTFVTTFEYVIAEPAVCRCSNETSALKLPLKARISVKGMKTCDPSAPIKRQQ